MDPFDRSLDSPIGRVRELFARAPGAVVGVGGMSSLQTGSYIRTPTEGRLAALAAQADPPDLFVISGSAGSGKSALIDRLESQNPGVFGQVLQDATHSDSPSESQVDVLEGFFEPYRDSAAEPPARPRIIAANIGLLLAFFTALGERGNHPLTRLEGVLMYRLGLRAEAPPDLAWSAAVVNLDLRPTAGPEGLLREMLALLDFDNPSGILGGAPRCQTCTVRAWCPVRSNSLIARHASEAIDTLAERAATERGRHDSPRLLWDFTARLLCGDDPFDAEEDPCDAAAAAAEREDRAWVWERLLPRKLFSVGGELGERTAQLDPSLQPLAQAHRLLASAGILPEADARELQRLDPPAAEAIATAAAHLAAGKLPAAELGRALVTASFLRDPAAWQPGDLIAHDFHALLLEYERFSGGDAAGPYPELERLRRLIERALGRSFGLLEGDTPYVPVEAYDPREPSRVFVEASLHYDDGTYEVLPDPPVQRDPGGAELAGHTPLSLAAKLGGVEIVITTPVYRLLRAAESGTVASTADLERFYGLRRAVEALARTASHHRQLAVQRPGTSRRYNVSRSAGLGGQKTITVTEARR